MSEEFVYENQIEWCPNVDGFIFYALKLRNGDIYKGYTAHFRNRMLAHFNGRGCRTTMRNKPEYILHHEVFETKKEAMDRERYYKTKGHIKLFEGRDGLNGFKP